MSVCVINIVEIFECVVYLNRLLCCDDQWQDMSFFESNRRIPGGNWGALVCCINRDLDTCVVIGSNNQLPATQSGNIACFANDISEMHIDNDGALNVSITKL